MRGPAADDGKPSDHPWDSGVTIVYTTCRREPRFDWFCDSLARQLDGEARLEAIFVDAWHSEERERELARAVRGRFEHRHVPPKPSPYNGPHRLTKREYFAASSARNTGIVHARLPYVAFVDDASVLMPGWWKELRRAARLRYVVAGAYRKAREMEVRDGVLLRSRSEAAGLDSRWDLAEEGSLAPISGGQLYGSSFGAPRDLLLAVDGFDELCDTARGEDYHLGLRLEWSGETIYYSRSMLTIESEALHQQGPVLGGIDWCPDPGAYARTLRRFGVRRRSTEGPRDISHMVLDILYGTRCVRSLGNYYTLSELREDDLPRLVERFPKTHWFTGQPLGEL